MRILILQAGFNELGVIDQLKKEGHYVIAIGNQPGLIGQQYVDEYYCQDYSQKDEVLQFMLEKKIDYICACCNDTAVLTSVYVAEKMELPGFDSYKSARIIAHKNLFKRFAKDNGIYTLPAEEFDCVEAAEVYIRTGIKYPIIVKPVDLSGGKGVARCDDESEALKAVHNAFKMSKQKNIVIEPFISGTQHGFCTFLKDKKVTACCSNDEYSVVNPYRVEIDMFPASNIDKYQDILISQVEKMAEILDLSDGIFHLQYMESDGKIYILEAMRRIIGNMYSVPAAKACGFDWDCWEARASIGESCLEAPKKMKKRGYYAYRAIIAPKNGVIKEIKIDESLEKYIFDRIMLEKKGNIVENYKSSTLGIVFFEFQNSEEMERVLLDEYDKICVDMEE